MAKITTITNPLTGQPAQVDQLDHTAQQIDDAIARALPGGAIDLALSSKPNPNLLDNWYFGNPVDQRGGYVTVATAVGYFDENCTNAGAAIGGVFKATKIANGNYTYQFNNVGNYYYCKPSDVVRGYTGTGYGIDRWALGPSQTLLIRDNHIALSTNDGTNWLMQKIEHHTKYVGSTLTTSALITAESAGTMRFMFSDSETQGGWGDSGWSQVDFSENETKLITFTRKVERGMAGLIFQPITAGVWFDIHAAKLELGDHQTLAHQDENGNWVLNEIPDFGEQLARCQRYYLKLKYNRLAGYGDEYWAHFTIPTPATMRTPPTIKSNAPCYCYTSSRFIQIDNPVFHAINVCGNSVSFDMNIVDNVQSCKVLQADSLELYADL